MIEPKVVQTKARSKSPQKQKEKSKVRKPQPPRLRTAKRPLTAKQIEEQFTRCPITQEELHGKHDVPIEVPTVRPDNADEQRLTKQVWETLY